MAKSLPLRRINSGAFQRDMDGVFGQMRAYVENNVDGFETGTKEAGERRARALQDFCFFAHTYFPHYVNQTDSKLHTWLYRELPAKITGSGVRLAIAAPRGEAKSTICTLLFVVWVTIGARKRCIPIIMDALHQARVMLVGIKAELEANPRLLADFPGVAGQGPVWRDNVIVTKNSVKIQAFGSGQRIRGLRHGQYRPDLAVLDDIENDVNVRSVEYRDRLLHWINTTVLNLSDAAGNMDILVIGTVLHADSVLSRLMQSPGWRSVRFQAIEQWPDNMKMWDEWANSYRLDGEEKAHAFYDTHRITMDAGAILTWPSVRTLEKLMIKRAVIGADAFDAEMQNDPLSTTAIFTQLHTWEGPIGQDWVYYGAVDPSLGRVGGNGDPSAIVIGAMDRLTGVLRVVEADIQRRLPDQIIATVIQYQRRYKCRMWVVESVQFQEFFRAEMVKRSAAVGVPVPAKGVRPMSDKALRISAIQPHCANGLILFQARQSELLRQLRHFGESGIHDDGPDALEMLWTCAIQQGLGAGEVRSIGRRVSATEAESYDREGFGSPSGMEWMYGFQA